MGYTHYWERPDRLDATTFKAFAADVRKLISAAESVGLRLAGPTGEGKPRATARFVEFNGAENCGHGPTETVRQQFPVFQLGGDNVLAATLVLAGRFEHYQCNGSGGCVHESFVMTPTTTRPDYQKGRELAFDFCKTARKHYDLLVTGVLLAFKRHFGDAVVVTSDGNDSEWEDARLFCSLTLGYGLDYHITRGGLQRVGGAIADGAKEADSVEAMAR